MSVKFDFGTLDAPFEADWPVTVSVPQDGGKTQEQVFTARFRLLGQAELEKAQESDNTDGFVEAFFVGLGEAEARELTPELRAKIVGRPFVRVALLKAFRDFQTGIAAKN